MPTDDTTDTTDETADTAVLPIAFERGEPEGKPEPEPVNLVAAAWGARHPDGPEPEPEPEPAANDTPQRPAAPPSDYEVRVTITPARRVVVRVDETTGVVYEEPVKP